jgi:subtilase family serine protease
MSIYFSSSKRRAALAAVLASGSMAFLSAPSSAQPVLGIGKLPVGMAAAPAVLLATIPGHVPDLVNSSTLLGVLPAGQALTCSITLPLRNQAALADLLHGLSNPSDPRYGQYLTPSEFADQFGPSQISYNALIAYLHSKGLTVTQTFPSRTYLSLAGTAGQLNAAFGITLKQFQSPAGSIFHAPDTDVKVPATIAGYISAVTGLDDSTPPVPLLHQFKPRRATQLKAIVPILDGAGPLVQDPGEQGTGPQGGFAPSDIRTAYSLNSTALDGTGQTCAIIEYGTEYNIKDALKYENQFGLKRVPITIIPVDGGPTAYEADGPAETNIDIACQLSMAPKTGIRLYLEGRGSNTDAINAVASDNIAKQLSISYGFGSESRTATTPSASQTALNTAYTQLAAQGISVYVSAGDSGSQADSNGRTSVDISSSAPMACAVGGTALVVQSPGVNENYLAESTWNYNNTAAGGAGGGGISKQWTIPSYQLNAATFASKVSGSNVSATQRNLPDISCDASPETGIAVYVSEDPGLSGPGWYIFGGTSEAAPLWAGYTALVNQNRALAGLPGTLGFPNSTLYPLAYSTLGLTKSYTSVFHDINDGSSNLTVAGSTNFAAVTGFDDSTGLGTMQGAALIAALSNGILVK